MIKHKKILDYAISSLLRRKYKNLAIMGVFCVIIAVLASILFLTHSLKTEALNILDGTPELIIQKVSAGRHALIPVAYEDRIKAIPGVGKVVPRHWGYYYDSLTGGNYTIIGMDGNMTGMELLDGRMPEREGECAVGTGVAEARITGPGGSLPLTGSSGETLDFTITGVFRAESDILTHDLILLQRDDVLNLFGQSPDTATDMVVEVFNESEVRTVAGKIRQLIPDSRPIMKSEIIRTYDAVFNWRSGMVLTMFLGALLAFCILAWDKATGLSADEKQEIGILKALGWETSDVLELKFWEGTVISLTSFLLGLALAYAHVFFFGASFLAPALKGWSVLFPEFRLIPRINLFQVTALFFLSVIPYVASTVIPSWKASITDPDIVMRG